MTTYAPGSFFVTPVRGWVGWLIAFGQLCCRKPSSFGHAGIVTDADGTTMEAQPGGARPGNVTNYPHALICDGPILGLPEAQRAAARERVRQYALMEKGTPYSPLDYVALALLHLHLPSRWVRNRVRSSGHMICSQMVTAVFEDAGIDLFTDGRLPGDVMPADLAFWAENWQRQQVESTRDGASV